MKTLIIKYIQSKLLDNKSDFFKEAFIEKLLKDSKSLSIVIAVVNLSILIFTISLALLLIYMFQSLNFSLNSSILYTAGTFLFISSGLFIFSSIFVRKKLSLYQNLSTIKRNTNDFSWLEPLVEQLKLEQSKMKKNISIHRLKKKPRAIHEYVH